MANTYKDSTLLHLVNAKESGRQGNTQLAYKKSTHNFAWELTDEGWQISSTDAISKNEAKGSSVYKQYGVDAPEWRHGFQADAKIPLKEGEYWGGSVSYNFFFLGYGIMGVKAEFLSFGGEHEEYDEWYGQNVSVKDDFLGGLHINVGGQLPIKLGRVVLAPYITGGVCVSNAGFFVTPVGGMRLGFEFKNSTCLFLDANYTYRYQVFDFDGESVNPHSVEAGIGFAW